MDKLKLCKEIGTFFGNYFEENNQLCIDTGLQVFRYNTPDQLLTDWVDTLLCHQYDTDHKGNGQDTPSFYWEKEILFIYTSVIVKYPTGIRLIENKGERTWQSYVDINDGSRHGKNLHLGTYRSIVDAIFARNTFMEEASMLDRNTTDFPNNLIQLAQKIRDRSKQNRQYEKRSKKVSEMIAKYGLRIPQSGPVAIKTAQEEQKHRVSSQGGDQMTFFEQELRKIIGEAYPDATFVGRACYVPLSELNRAKIQFTVCGNADHYEALQLTILNRNDGQIDTLRLRFSEVWGRNQVKNLFFQQTGPHAWTYNNQTIWYMYQPVAADYHKLRENIKSYLDVFLAHEDRKPELSATIQTAECQASAQVNDKRHDKSIPQAPER